MTGPIALGWLATILPITRRTGSQQHIHDFRMNTPMETDRAWTRWLVCRLATLSPLWLGVRNLPQGVDWLRKSTAAAALFYINWRKKHDATGMKIIFGSKPYPSRALTAGPRVDAASREKLRAALLRAHEAGLDAVLKMLKKPRFAASSDAEHRDWVPCSSLCSAATTSTSCNP